jgi:hypothetical protein
MQASCVVAVVVEVEKGWCLSTGIGIQVKVATIDNKETREI